MLYWAFVGVDTGARSVLGQRFQRAIKHNPQAKAVYADLDEGLKLEFRKAWALKRDWEFTRESRSVVVSHTEEDTERGELMNSIQVANALGGMEHHEARSQAAAYIAMCEQIGGKYVQYNSWTQTKNYLFVRRLLNSTNAKEWLNKSESSASENLWEARAKECKARQNYATAKGLSLQAVSIEDVAGTNEGIDGWAAADPAPQGKKPANAKAKAKANPGPSEGDGEGKKKPKPLKTPNPLNKNLQDAQAILAKLSRCHIEVNKAKASAKENPDEWQWAAGFFTRYDACRAEAHTAEQSHGNFPEDFRAAVCSPAAMRDFKKAQGTQLLANLVNFTQAMQPHADRASEIADRIRAMSLAAARDEPAPQSKAGKRKRAA